MKNTAIIIRYLIFGAAFLSLAGCDSTPRESGTPAHEESTARAEIMLVGVYHFSNPGKDTYNLTVDDYLAANRQEQIQEVVDLLASYHPTKIFVELLPEAQNKIDSLYRGYANDQWELNQILNGENEVYQIGFRLAKKWKLDGVVCIDAGGNWLGPYVDFIADTLSYDIYNAYRQNKKENMAKLNQQFLDHTVKENLVYSNRPEIIQKNHDYYNNIAIRVQDTLGIAFQYQEIEENIEGLPYLLRSFDFNNIGVEMIAEWYKRNLFIYRNILQRTADEDRIVVLFGQGHIQHLNQLLQDNPEYEIVSVLDYLNPKN
jgi:hypothetical protein